MGQSISVLKKRAEAAKSATPANNELAVAWHLRSLLVPSETVHWKTLTISGPWLQETWVGPESTWEKLCRAGSDYRQLVESLWRRGGQLPHPLRSRKNALWPWLQHGLPSWNFLT
jgi:hypothetical protein